VLLFCLLVLTLVHDVLETWKKFLLMNVGLILLEKHVVLLTLDFTWYSCFSWFLMLKYSFYCLGSLEVRVPDYLDLLDWYCF